MILCVSHSSGLRAWATAATLLASGGPAAASLAISNGKTEHIVCNKGVCTATEASAVLNVASVQAMLSKGDLTIEAGPKALNIIIETKLSWPGASLLKLSAARSIVVTGTVTAAGTGGMTIALGKGGSLSFGPAGSIGFLKTSSALTINGVGYTLVETLPDLVAAVSAKPGYSFALAANYDAKADGAYAHAPITAEFSGKLQGLGHTIANMSIADSSADKGVGLFAFVYPGAVVENLHLQNVSISTAIPTDVGALAGQVAGALAGITVSGSIAASAADTYTPVTGGMVGMLGASGSFVGSITRSSANVRVTSGGGPAGGLVGRNFGGRITTSSATGAVTGSSDALVGGLVGINAAKSVISESYATGPASVGGLNVATFGSVGGLAGGNGGTIENCYATGSAGGGLGVAAGGLIGLASGGTVKDSYATGPALGTSGDGYNAALGGVVGDSGGSFSDTYWDTTTSGAAKGAGHGSAAGMTGETSATLAARLPVGFNALVWHEKTGVLGGLPYLAANPPSP